MSAHTQAPWYTRKYGEPGKSKWSGWHIGVEPGREVGPPDIATVDDVDYGPEIAKANAAHIVRCVNAHDGLVAALRDILPHFIELRNYRALREGTAWTQDFENAENKVRAALTKAQHEVCHHATMNKKTGRSEFLCNLPAGHTGPHNTLPDLS